MNGFKSRKFLMALIGVAAGIVAAFILPAFGPFAWLKEYSVAIFTAACSLAGAYMVGNAATDWINKNESRRGNVA